MSECIRQILPFISDQERKNFRGRAAVQSLVCIRFQISYSELKLSPKNHFPVKVGESRSDFILTVESPTGLGGLYSLFICPLGLEESFETV